MKIYKITGIGIAVVLLSACKSGKKEYDATGVFETTEVLVSAKGNGAIKKFDVREGQNISPQTFLGYIDTMQLHLKKEQLRASRKALAGRRTNISVQTASLQQQIDIQKREQKRFENLVKSDVANQKQMDDITAQITVLEKQLAAQTETLSDSNRNITEESTALDMQIAQLDDQIKNSLIYSPIKGTVLKKYAEQGETAIPGKALFKVGDIENMYLRAYITASQLTFLQIGQEVAVYSDLGEKDRKEYQGMVTWIADKAEFTPKTIQTRDERTNLVYAVKIAIKNDGFVKIGMYGEMKIKN
jgi:HlyD family secretion protein